MFARLLLALALEFFALAPHAFAGPKAAESDKQCPHALSEFDQINADLDKAPSCSAPARSAAPAMSGSAAACLRGASAIF
jgi:hypothetical protein